MKKLLLVAVGILCTMLAFGQTNFQELTLEEACKKAKLEKKLIFVDLYTSWCEPCRMMADRVFPDQVIGEFMNENFVCVKYNTEVAKDGMDLVKKFNVQSYPTFLMLNTNLELENQIIGATLEPLDFKAQVEEAMKASLASLGKQYAEGDRDMQFLAHYLKELSKSRMEIKAKEVCEVLFKVLPDTEKTNPEYWFIYDSEMLAPVNSAAMDYLLSHFKQFRKTVGEEKILNRISSAFEIKLINMLSGREKINDLDKMAKQMAPFHFNSRERLDVYVAIAKALRLAREKNNGEKEIEKLLVLCEKEFPKMDGQMLVRFYFPITFYIANVGTAAQRTRVRELHQYIYDHTNYERFKYGLGNLLNAAKNAK